MGTHINTLIVSFKDTVDDIKNFKKSKSGLLSIFLFFTTIFLMILSVSWASDFHFFVAKNIWFFFLFYFLSILLISLIFKENTDKDISVFGKVLFSYLPLIVIFNVADNPQGEVIVDKIENVSTYISRTSRGKSTYCHIINEHISIETNTNIFGDCKPHKEQMNVVTKKSRLGYYEYKYICKNNNCLIDW